MDKKVDWIVDLLVDDYFRCYAPQRTQRRSTAAQNKNAGHTLGDPSTKTRRIERPIRGGKGSRRRKAIDDEGDSDDENSRGYGRGSSDATKFSNSRRFACPFLKWNPKKFGAKCTLRLKEISHVKDHLKKKHYLPYCHDCHMLFLHHPILDHACVFTDFPDYLITDDQLEALKKRVNMSYSHEEQWQEIYSMLFPCEPLCSNPYLDVAEDETLRKLKEFLYSKQFQAILHEEMTCMEYDDRYRARTHKLVLERAAPRWISTYALNSESPSCITHDESQATGLAQPSQTVDPREINTPVPYYSGSCSLQQVPDVAATFQICPTSTFSQPPESMSGLFTNQPRIENTISDALSDVTGNEDPSSNLEFGGAGFYEIGSCEMSADESFSCLLRHETYQTDFDLEWNTEGLIQE